MHLSALRRWAVALTALAALGFSVCEARPFSANPGKPSPITALCNPGDPPCNGGG